MSDPLPVENPTVNLRTITHVAYGLFAFGFVTAGFFGIATVASPPCQTTCRVVVV